jgi:hypothetical protein
MEENGAEVSGFLLPLVPTGHWQAQVRSPCFQAKKFLCSCEKHTDEFTVWSPTHSLGNQDINDTYAVGRFRSSSETLGEALISLLTVQDMEGL